jgi:serine/threonine protein phosphatase 1
MKTLPIYIEYKDCRNDKGDYLLVSHSTAAYAWDEYAHDSPQFKDNLLWERTPFPAKIDGIFNCYGHTPQRGGATVKEHFAAIDGGAYFKREPYGRMIALQYPELIIYEQENVE